MWTGCVWAVILPVCAGPLLSGAAMWGDGETDGASNLDLKPASLSAGGGEEDREGEVAAAGSSPLPAWLREDRADTEKTNLPLPGVEVDPGAARARVVLAELRRAWGEGNRAEQRGLARLGVCSDGGADTTAVIKALSALVTPLDPREGESLEADVLYPTKEHWEEEGEKNRWRLTLQFTLSPPQRPLLPGLTPLLLFSLRGGIMKKALTISFTAHPPHTDTQTTCVSEDTQFIVLTGGLAQTHAHGHLMFRVAIQTHHTDSGPVLSLSDLKGFLSGEDKEHNATLSPVLLLNRRAGRESPGSGPAEDRAEPELTPHRGSGTFRFLLELQEFLREVLPPSGKEQHPPNTEAGTEEPPTGHPSMLFLNMLQSAPTVPLGPSTGEGLLLSLLNSSTPMLFSFPRHPSALLAHRGELALSPHLLAILRVRLDAALAEVGLQGRVKSQSARDRLRTLLELSTLPPEGSTDTTATSTQTGPPSERQYRAVLLLTALRTVRTAWERWGQEDEEEQPWGGAGRGRRGAGERCRLQTLRTSLRGFQNILSPDSMLINNCQGACRFPQTGGGDSYNNHVVLLIRQQELGPPLQRPPCCVPVRYSEYEVAVVTDSGSAAVAKANMVAEECGCR
ncbi:muellerian-inhibiting factor isoform X2 [Amia ocellicauda]|uniref:muellerian-inhibiting factor isoform X2 n=1 Tax=Amia ocellicauda TaxID=2972642 RepID=UPI0034643177